MNLPNAITVGRIALVPAVALLPFVSSWGWRLTAFALFLVAAISDYWDGRFARSRNLITNLGKLLDPLADKLLLVGTFTAMFILVGSGSELSLGSPHHDPLVAGTDAVRLRLGTVRAEAFPLLTPMGPIGLPWWIVAIVLGRELFMTVFRQAAVRRGVYIAAIGPAKWKTGFQWTWVGATYFWFSAATLATIRAWTSSEWRAFAWFNAAVALVAMAGALGLTLYSLWLYLRLYGPVVFGRRTRAAS